MNSTQLRKRFEKKFGCHVGGWDEPIGKHSNYSWNTIFSFFQSLLAEKEAEVVKKLKNFHKKKGWDCVAAGEGQECCVDEFLSTLTLKEEQP